jgi:AmmeMemoRadiSam system protein A
MAIAAATRDPRFAPVSAAEAEQLRISVTVLGPTFPIAPADIRIGVHGLVVSRGSARGVLLPQVAVEQGWDVPTFLAQTSVKAGLAPDAWNGEGTTIEAFTALHAEDEPSGR